MLRLSALRGLKRVTGAAVKFPTPSSSSSSASSRARLLPARKQSSVPMQDMGASTTYTAAAPDATSVANQRVIGYWLLGMGGLVAGMVTVGGVTRLTRSGLSMTDWKLQGSLPPMTLEVRLFIGPLETRPRSHTAAALCIHAPPPPPLRAGLGAGVCAVQDVPRVAAAEKHDAG